MLSRLTRQIVCECFLQQSHAHDVHARPLSCVHAHDRDYAMSDRDDHDCDHVQMLEG